MNFLLQGKKVLFVAPRFFGYEQEILQEMVRRGASVDFLLDRPFDSPFFKAITRFYRGLIIKAADRYYRDQLAKFQSTDYDYVFVVNGQTLSDTTLNHWRQTFKTASFLLYMWDSFGNRRWAVDNIKQFDHVFSFDKGDAEKYNLHFRPLFFSGGFEASSTHAVKWQLSFVGTAHTDRFSIISKVSRSLPSDVRTFFYMYLQAKWVYWLYRLTNPHFRKARLNDFKFLSIDKASVQSIFNSSACILDIEHPKQTGLTMRTLETLGSGKKLVTTNKSIVDYDFFDERNICVLNRHTPKIPDGFLNTPYYPVEAKIYQRYMLGGWMNEIFAMARK